MRPEPHRTDRSTKKPAVPSASLPSTSSEPLRTSGLVRPAGRTPDKVSFDDAVVSFFVDAADILGVPKSVAAIYGICFASADPLSFSEIDERLEISSGSISQGLRVLKEVGALKVADAPRVLPEAAPVTNSQELSTSARAVVRFEPDLEMRKLVLQWIEKRLQAQLTSGSTRLDQIIQLMPPRSAKSLAALQMRFESLRTWHQKARSLLPLAKTFLKLT